MSPSLGLAIFLSLINCAFIQGQLPLTLPVIYSPNQRDETQSSVTNEHLNIKSSTASGTGNFNQINKQAELGPLPDEESNDFGSQIQQPDALARESQSRLRNQPSQRLPIQGPEMTPIQVKVVRSTDPEGDQRDRPMLQNVTSVGKADKASEYKSLEEILSLAGLANIDSMVPSTDLKTFKIKTRMKTTVSEKEEDDDDDDEKEEKEVKTVKKTTAKKSTKKSCKKSSKKSKKKSKKSKKKSKKKKKGKKKKCGCCCCCC